MTLRIGYHIHQFPPETGAGAARAVEMATRWIERGASVTIFTGMPNRPEGRIHPGYGGKLFMREPWNGIDVRRSWLYASPKHGFARTLLNNITFMGTSAVHGVAAGGELDVLIASSPPFFMHLAGAAIASARRIPLVLEVRDLWPDYLVGMGMLQRDRRATKALFATERALLGRADAVTVVTEPFRKRVIEKGVDPSRVSVFPNGVDTSFYYRSDEAPPIPALQRRDPGEFIVGYLGNIGAGQGLLTMLDVASMLAGAHVPIRLVLVGDGPQGELLRRGAVERSLANISVHPPVPKAATRAFYANCDVCLVPLAPVAEFQETIPSKIFEILACERPIVASVDGEGKRIVTESEAGLVAAPGDAASIARAIRAAYELTADARRAMGARGRRYVAEHYSRPMIADRYLETLQAVAR